MSIVSPIFPMPEPHHYSDFGFDPQIDYFQVLEEARRHTKRTDSIHFKLQKPISKDHDRSKSMKRKRWWKSALNFWKKRKSATTAGGDNRQYNPYWSVTSPVYVTESVSGGSTPCWAMSRSASGPLMAAEVGDAELVPYVCLREVNLTGGHRISASNAPTAMPIYLVT